MMKPTKKTGKSKPCRMIPKQIQDKLYLHGMW